MPSEGRQKGHTEYGCYEKEIRKRVTMDSMPIRGKAQRRQRTRMLLGRKQKRDREYGWYEREGSKGTVNEDAIREKSEMRVIIDAVVGNGERRQLVNEDASGKAESKQFVSATG